MNKSKRSRKSLARRGRQRSWGVGETDYRRAHAQGSAQKSRKRAEETQADVPMSTEATVVRNYIDAMISLPWRKKSKTNHDLANAQTTLDEDHYGLEKVKERILEYLAVQQRVGKVKA